MLDCLTDGRLAAGFPVGTSMDVNRCYGVTPTETRPRFYEAHDLIMKAWTKPGPFAYNGRFNQLRYVNPWPTAAAEALTRRCGWPAAARWRPTRWRSTHDYTYSYLSFFGYQYAKKLMGGFWETMDRSAPTRTPTGPASRSRSASRRPTSGPRSSTSSTSRTSSTSASTSRRTSSRRPGYRTRRSTEFAIKTEPARRDRQGATVEKNWKSLVETTASSSPAARTTVAERLIEAARSLRIGNLHRAAPDRVDAPRAHREEHHPVRRRGSCRRSATSGPTTAGSTSGGRWAPTTGAPSDGHGRSDRRRLDDAISLRNGIMIRVRRWATGVIRSSTPRRRRPHVGPVRGRAGRPVHRLRAPSTPARASRPGSRARRDIWDLVLYYNDLLDALELPSGHAWSGTRSAAWWRPSWRPTTPSG